jgi:imidazole glycerol-phosphate synthase subunit HisH
MRVAIVDPGSGNLASVARALDRAAAMAGLPIETVVSRDAGDVARADRIVLPGQGAFAAVMRGLAALPEMLPTLETQRRDGVPLFGICVGMQVLAQRGLEHGTHSGLAWIAGDITAMAPAATLPLPQMGWNTLDLAQPAHPLLAGIAPATHAYFVHSYALTGGDPADLLATTDYGGPVAAMVARDNLAGTQFHVEKSGALGLRLLANFLRWKP